MTAASPIDERRVVDSTQPGKQSRSEREQDRAAREFERAKDGKQQPAMKVKVYSPFRNYYDSTAFSISAESATGPFDILPHHHNFISLLSACDLVIRPAVGNEQKIVISGGIMHVKADQVIVFLDV